MKNYLIVFFIIHLLTAYSPSLYAQGTGPLRPIIVLIHGRGQDTSDNGGARTAAAWTDELKRTLRIEGIALHNDDFRFCWYGDLLGKAGVRGCTHHEMLPQERNTPFTDHIKHQGIQAVMNAVALLPVGKGFLLEQVMPDVQVYLSDQRNQCAINDRIENSFNEALKAGRPLIVVAHSLGSLAAYIVLNRDPNIVPRIKDVKFITVGSMLGMAGVRKALLGDFMTGSLAIPESIASWFNIVNLDDYLSFSLKSTFLDPRERRVGKEFEISKPFGHDAKGYLSTPEVRAILVESFK